MIEEDQHGKLSSAPLDTDMEYGNSRIENIYVYIDIFL